MIDDKDGMSEKVYNSRHSLAHVLAKAICELYDDVKLAIGPPIDNGFYYDFDIPVSILEEDFPKIEQRMNEILKRNESFVREEVTTEKALEIFKDNPYKVELIKDLDGNEQISLYWLGDDFVDLCRGPHVESASHLRSWAFKIKTVTGAYWRGNSDNKMLQRVYVYAFESKAELKSYLNFLEEAKKRDHRKIGKEQELFAIMDEGPGFPFFLPKGMILRNKLLDFWHEIHDKAGYKEISTPVMLNRSLWERSGHWYHYQDNMYTTVIDEQDFAIKPMNCPGGILVYASKNHSYRELPMRIGELGLVHRHELSGALHGLMRVRCFTQDDAHIFMTKEQIKDEIKGVVKLIDEVYTKTFGFPYKIELSTQPENSMGSKEDWDIATKALGDAISELGYEYVVNEGDGAFYGPKLDFHLTDCLGRTWQCGTIQLDFQLPERFELEYAGADGKQHRPIMIHRVVFGSVERFIGILTEHFAGKFPFWLSPSQVGIVPVRAEHGEYADKISGQLQSIGIRAEVDHSDENMGTKIKNFRHGLLPYIIIVGDKEQGDNTISLRVRSGKQVNNISLESFITACKTMISQKSIDLIDSFN